MTKKPVKKEIIEVKTEEPKEDILTAGAARQRKQEDAGAASAAFDEVEQKPVKKTINNNNSLEENVSMLSIQQKLKLERQKFLMNALTPMG
jgi:hypothetical protein